MSDVSRRRVLQLGALGGAALAGGAALSGARPAAAATATATAAVGGFARPGPEMSPRFRWWWPDGDVDPAEVAREVDQLADAGFGGGEIAAVTHSIDDKSILDVAVNGWATPRWIAGVEAALERAAVRGLTIDVTIGPAWPAAVPTVTPDDPAAMKELAHGVVTVTGSYSGPVPPPAVAAASGVTAQALLAVQAVRLDAANTTRKQTGLDPTSLVDLTAQVDNGQVSWTAPDQNAWILIAYWERGSAQTPESGPHTSPAAYVVDHFSAAGTSAVTGFWDSVILTQRVRTLLRRAGRTFFEDSIELETNATLWTPDFPAEFERRMGYSVLPYLPVVVTLKSTAVYAYDAETTAHVLHDVWEVFSQLFNENHYEALQRWANSIGLKMRAQPYGLQTDAILTSALLDMPEGETIGFKNLDDFRCMAGGRDMAGTRILSCEAGAYLGGAYNTTWKKWLRTMGGAYASGVNHTNIHGFSYATAPDVAWPGYAAFTPYHGAVGYAESWGPRQPTWHHIRDISGYLARIHQVMQSGQSRVDVAILRQTGYVATGIGATWFTASGVPLGWTQQFISLPLLDLPGATVKGNRLAAPGYKVVFVDADFFESSEHTLTVDAATKLLAFARAGLPIVMLGDWSAPVVPGLAKAGDNERLTGIVAQILAQPSVQNPAAAADVPAALTSLGLQPTAQYAQSSTLLNAHRVAGGVDYYYLCNGQHAETVKPPVAPIDHQVAFTRTSPGAVPYRLDLWSGEIRPIAEYTEDGDRVSVRVALQPSEAYVVALAPRGWSGALGRGQYATASTADTVVFTDQGLAVRAATAGTYTTTLSGGRTVSTTIAEVPGPITPASWQLQVDDWQPGATPTQTNVVTHTVALAQLSSWADIPELQDCSGIGRYTTTVQLADPWTGGYGAYLSLGAVVDTCRVTVNGTPLPPVAEMNPVVDLGPHLRRGTNTIEVEVATTLNNRLRVSDPAVYGVEPRQDYGLMGPVQITPYGEATVTA